MNAWNETEPQTGTEQVARAITAARTGHTAINAQLAEPPRRARGLPWDRSRSSSA